MTAAFVYDGDCAFCTRFATWLRRRAGGRVDVVAAQRVSSLDALGLTDDDVRASSWFVTDTGVRLGRQAGIGAALEATNGPWRVVGRALRARPISPLAGAVYNWVAGHRHRLPGGTPSCRL